jgi:tRNA (cytidine/uridine-2'-O-)-methyltransferase
MITRVTAPRLNVVLYQPEIPQNTGNIGRTCVAVGAKLWIVRPTGFRLDDRHLRRSGLDYWQHLDWEDVQDFATLQLRLPPERTFYLTKNARRLYTDVQYQRGDFLVFGRETNGLPAQVLEANPAHCLRIPMQAEARSLNLANAVAIVVYEALRQWAPPPA